MVNYGCCKTKSFPNTYYICKNCFKVFHRSCVQQSKSKFKFLKDFQITCCDNNENKHVIDEKSILEQTISDLTDNSVTQNKYIERIKHEHKAFVEEATQLEDDLLEQMQKYRKCIEEYEAEILELRATIKRMTIKSTKNGSTQTRVMTKQINEATQTANGKEGTNSLSTQITNVEESASGLGKDVNEQIGILQEMLTSIETLTQENKMYQLEIDELKSKFNLFNHDELKEKKKSTVRPAVVGRKVLIVSHYRGRNVGVLLKNLLGNNFVVESIVKPDANDNELIRTALQKGKLLGRNDMVILWPNTSSSSLVRNFLLQLKNTQRLIVTVPYRSDSSSKNNVIYEKNLELLKSAYQAELGHCIFECNNVLRKSNYFNPTNLNRKGKYYLSKSIKNIIHNCEGTKLEHDEMIASNKKKLISAAEIKRNCNLYHNRPSSSTPTEEEGTRSSFLDLRERKLVSM